MVMRRALYVIVMLVLAVGVAASTVGCPMSDDWEGDLAVAIMSNNGTHTICVENIGDGVTGGDPAFCKPAKPDEWHFVLNGLNPKDAAPGQMTAVFAEGTVVIGLAELVGGPASGVAHYRLGGYLNATLLGGYAELSVNATYLVFVLSHAPCGEAPPVSYNLTISSTTGGSATATASPTIVIGPGETKTKSDLPAGTVVSVVATPAGGYRFVNWTGDVGTIADVEATSTTITMNGDYSITANFELIRIEDTGYELTLTVSPPGGGTAIDLTGAGRYEEGDTVAIKAIAADCYVFVNWTATAGVLADPYAAETTFTMPGQDVIVTANFEFIGNPTRALPDHVLPGERFEVTVTFAAPSDGFHAIALTDIAPAGWEVRVNVVWADPEATAVNTPAAETAAYVWYGPYDLCVPFTAVYEVRVPVNAEPGAYTFSGSLKYYIEPHPAPPYEQEVTGDIEVRVEEGETVRIAGVTREVDGAILRGAVVVLYQNGEEIGEVVSDGSGNYEFEFSEFGDYEVVVRKAGFTDEAQSVSTSTLAIYTVDFVSDQGLIPDAPSISYVLACVSLWKFGEPPLQLSTFRVLDVVSAWMYPRT